VTPGLLAEAKNNESVIGAASGAMYDATEIFDVPTNYHTRKDHNIDQKLKREGWTYLNFSSTVPENVYGE
jgi:hypothetical protein